MWNIDEMTEQLINDNWYDIEEGEMTEEDCYWMAREMMELAEDDDEE